MAPTFARYGIEADSEWAREQARRQQILANYDIHETGLSEDLINGGASVNALWFKIAHPTALRCILDTMGFMPEVFGANRENHIMRTTGVVNSVVYGDGNVQYSTFDAPRGTEEVLRLAFEPSSVTADGKALARTADPTASGYTVKKLTNGDCTVSIRHDGLKSIEVKGDDPQQIADDDDIKYEGEWTALRETSACGGSLHSTDKAGAAASFAFRGNQVRLIGAVDKAGGLADVYIDGAKQLVGIDFWNPSPRHRQVLYYKNGLSNSSHEIKIVARDEKNPVSSGKNVYVDAVEWSDATGDSGFGEGGGPTGYQRIILGYPNREDYIDSEGNHWIPGCEFTVRTGWGTDTVPLTWWTKPAPGTISGTNDQELYKYGVHAPEFAVNLIVGPGKYHARLKFAATRGLDTKTNCINILINGKQVVTRMNVAATAGGPGKAVDLVFNDIEPRNGTIEIRFVGGEIGAAYCLEPAEAFVQAIEVGPGSGGAGATVVSAPAPAIHANILVNPGFEDGLVAKTAATDLVGDAKGWSYEFKCQTACRVEGESHSARWDGSGASKMRCGNEALRIVGQDDAGGRVDVYQDVSVSGNAGYAASVWVRAVGCFGSNASDSAGLRILELNSEGTVVAMHDEVEVKRPTDYKRLSQRFTTSPSTTTLRFVLETMISCGQTKGHVTYDDCELIAAAKLP